MALTETTVIDKIEIVGEFKQVQVRQATVIERDGVEISRAYHRYVIAPTDDITTQPDEVKAVCNAVHTQEIKDAYSAFIAEQQGA
ncbi:hypothetical protein [uncultured Sphaerochaeta sp.]|uniref:hypothetical protein n=1 Tax=uncultured Sphaerochaeta sp. TaxID=886478 RepID=UPI0029CA4A27|nr:hypothetical protein [uncultured Sphaerochaeta sp.]